MRKQTFMQLAGQQGIAPLLEEQLLLTGRSLFIDTPATIRLT
jgi:hypothetical protein